MWRDKSNHVHLSGDEARGGEIILRTRVRRVIFLTGLVGVVVLAIIVGLATLR
jgi:hypothetical protein